MSQNIFSIIKSRISIADVIGQYTTLKRIGLYWKACCPFHNEKTASFTVSPHIEIFYCFGCHESGDVIAFIAKIENCTQFEAAQQLAERYGIEIADTQFDSSTKKKNSTEYQDVCSFFAEWCHQELKKNSVAQNYLRVRGISTASIDLFQIGFLPSGLPVIKRLLDDARTKNNILQHDFLEATILSESKSVTYSAFEDRIIFPIKDHLGRYCGFGGRTFKRDDERAKYYNSKESVHFSKGTLLFGLDSAKKAIQDAGEVFLVEGYLDCIAMVQDGHPNTVATLGTACTTTHLKVLGRYTNNLTVVYDSDNAGQQAILRLTQLCWHANIEPFVVTLPPGSDPASLIAEKKQMKQYLANKEDIFIFFIRSLSGRFSILPLNQKLETIKLLLATIATVDDSMKQNILLSNAAEKFDIQIDILKKEFQKVLYDRQQRQSTSVKEITHSKKQAPPKEDFLIENKIFCSIIKNAQFLKNEDFSVILSYLPSTLRTLLLKLKDMGLHGTQEIHFPSFFDTLSQEEKDLVTSILFKYESTDQSDFDFLVVQLKKKWWKTITQTIRESIVYAKQQGDQKRVNELLQDFVALQKTVVMVDTEKDSKTNLY
jgi:DNA primase